MTTPTSNNPPPVSARDVLITFAVTAGVLIAVWAIWLRHPSESIPVEQPSGKGYTTAKEYPYKYGRKLQPKEVTFKQYREHHLDEAKVTDVKERAAVANGMDTWYWWTGGNQAFWRKVAEKTAGLPITTDFLALLHQVPRAGRFEKLGTINDPDCVAAEEPDEYGLLIDRMKDGTGDYDADVYGWSSGIVGLRLFKNPKFQPKAWNLSKWLRDPVAVQPPYLVGMACAFCHVAFKPTSPPADPDEPKWNNVAAVIGNQFLSEGSVFARDMGPDQFIYHYLHTQPPGTSETSRLDTDFINNPTAMNSIYRLGKRLELRKPEQINAGQKKYLQALYKHMIAGDDPDLGGTDAQPTQKTPHVLLDGADSMGVPVASLRVWVNIGMHHDDWVKSWAVNPWDLKESLARNFEQVPFSIAKAQEDEKSFWRKTELRMVNLEKFAKTYDSYPLKDAKETPRPGIPVKDGADYLTKDPEVLKKGKIAFADHCASCHSSKRPDPLPGDKEGQKKAWRDLVLKDDFLTDNYLSDDQRHPVSELGTNAARALGTNALKGHIWEDFSSESYKNQTGVRGKLQDLDDKGKPRNLYNPLNGKYDIEYTVPDDRVAAYRTPSLVSTWATAPYLHNNSVGVFTHDPSIAGRMAAFDDGIRKLLWPERRLGVRSIKLTTQDARLPDLFDLIASQRKADGKLVLPIPESLRLSLLRVPKGTPVNLLANLHAKDIGAVLDAYVKGCLQGAPEEHFPLLHFPNHALGMERMRERMLALNTCPDFIEDRGHTYGRELSDGDKEALIEFIKTF